MTAPTMPQGASPALFFSTVNSYQRTAALKAAIELKLFTAVAECAASGGTAQAIAAHCGASERGTRILCDYLTILGFLIKRENAYRLTPDAEIFLDTRSPAYVGGAIRFLLSPMLTASFNDLAATVRKGGTVMGEQGSLEPEHSMWVEFAAGMAPLMALPAELIAQRLQASAAPRWKVLDIAAGHGMFGITLAKHNPNAEIVAVDWPNVLELAKSNARAAGVDGRYRALPGSAFDVNFGAGYDIVLLTNILHHFDAAGCEVLLRKVQAALGPGGRAVTLEFVPNEDRVTPPDSGMFSLVMLASTPAGDAYTFAEYDRMFRNAGFARSELYQLPPTFSQLIISHKE